MHVCAYAHEHGHNGTSEEVRGQFTRVSFLRLPCGSWGLNSGWKAWWQAFYPLGPLASLESCLLAEKILGFPY